MSNHPSRENSVSPHQPRSPIRGHAAVDRSGSMSSPQPDESCAVTDPAGILPGPMYASDDDIAAPAEASAGGIGRAPQTGTRSGVLLSEGSDTPLGAGVGDSLTSRAHDERELASTYLTGPLGDIVRCEERRGTIPKEIIQTPREGLRRRGRPPKVRVTMAPKDPLIGDVANVSQPDSLVTLRGMDAELNRIQDLIDLSNLNACVYDMYDSSSLSRPPRHDHHHEPQQDTKLAPAKTVKAKQSKKESRELVTSKPSAAKTINDLVEIQIDEEQQLLEEIERTEQKLKQLHMLKPKRNETTVRLGIRGAATTSKPKKSIQYLTASSESTDDEVTVRPTAATTARRTEIQAPSMNRPTQRQIAITTRRSPPSTTDVASDSGTDTCSHVQSVNNNGARKATPVRGVLKKTTLKDSTTDRTTDNDSADDFKESPKIRLPESRATATPKKLIFSRIKPVQGSDVETTPVKSRVVRSNRRKRHSDSMEIETENETASPAKKTASSYVDRRSLIKPEKYDGTTPLEVFLLQFNNCVEHNNWSDKESLAQLKGALKGTAAQVLMGAQGATLNYTTLINELRKCFGVEGHTAQHRIMLKTRRRHPGESLRALYQDVCRLLLLAYPGPQNELKDQLAVEAFIDSLDDAELEVSVKDRFPQNLAEAFHVALRLESNRPSTTRVSERAEKPNIEGRGRQRARHDMESRHVGLDDNYDDYTRPRVRQHDPEVSERLRSLEAEIRETKAELRRSKEREADETRICRLESQIQAAELRSRMMERALDDEQVRRRQPPSADSSISRNSSTETRTVRIPAVTPEKEKPIKKVDFHTESNNKESKPPESERFCPLCRGTGHHMSGCPQAYCGNCDSMGHTRRVCKVTRAREPPGPCPACHQTGHWKRDCPGPSRQQPSSTTNTTEKDAQKLKTNMVDFTKTSVNECTYKEGSRVYAEMECMGERRLFLLDSGCDVSLIPARYVRGATLLPTNRTAYAANASPIDLLGEVQINLTINQLNLPTKALVSDNVTEGLIGYDWLRDNDVYWSFGSGRISIRGEIIPLAVKHREDASCNRVVVESTTTIPARCEAVIPGKLVFDVSNVASRLDDNECTWVVEPRETEQGLCIAGTLLPPRSHNVPTRIINMSTRNIKLQAGDVLSEVVAMRRADVLDQPPTSTDTDSEQSEDWIAKLINDVHPSITVRDRVRLGTILKEYSDCFSQGEFDLGRANGVTHKIDTGDSRPIKQPLRRHPFLHNEEIDRQVHEMLKQDVIEPSNSPWASNVVVVKKKDNSLRFCVDYRRLNDVTIKDSYPLPRISDCLDALSSGRYFSAFDLRSGYFQVQMEESDKEKTSFVTRSGFYQFKVMPFGVTNGPATFQRLMDLTMAGLNYQICLVYLDDIILMSKTVEEHLERLKLVLDRLRGAGLKLKPSKCKLLQKTISFLGHVVSENGVATDPAKVQSVQEWPVPTNVTEVRSFIGLCSYYRRFVQDFARIAEPLHHLTGKTC